MREGLRHLQQRDQVARLLSHLPAGAFRTGLSAAAQLQARTAGLIVLCGAAAAQRAGLCTKPWQTRQKAL